MNKNKRIRSIEDLREVITPESRVLTLFSGGLDSSYLLYLLSQQKCTNITALSVDLGDDLDYEEIKHLATKLGAESIIVDRKKSLFKILLFQLLPQNQYILVYTLLVLHLPAHLLQKRR